MFDRKCGSGRRGLLAWVLPATVIAASMLATACGGQAPARGPSKPVLGPIDAEVTVPGQATTKAVPQLFLGISTEFTTLSLAEEHPVLFERVLDEFEPEDQELVMRIGGDSGEHFELFKNPIQAPPWAFAPTLKLVSNTSRIVEHLGLRTIFGINTITTTPRQVADWMRELVSLGKYFKHGKLSAFELGNEPDIYDPHAWAGGIDIEGNAAPNPHRIEPANLPQKITAAGYAGSFDAYARALHSAALTVPLVAPALAEPSEHVEWIETLLRHRTEALKEISAHIYPYSACAQPGQATYPAIQKILSENATAGMARTAAPAIVQAHEAGLGLRLTEINSVTCGGLEGVSNAFATALWAPDALFELLNAGVSGINLHARETSINRPFSFSSQGLETRPLLYGLILFARMIGPGARLVPVQLRRSQSLHLKVWAVRESVSGFPGPHERPIRNPLNVVVINKGSQSAVIALHLPTARRAFVQRLLAPSASSTFGVTLDGQQLNHQALWQGKRSRETLTPTQGGLYLLQIRGESAALLSVPVAAGTLDTPPQKAAGPAPLFGYE